jgi:two-component system phosphate regulon sensor histidine kinase PhoR
MTQKDTVQWPTGGAWLSLLLVEAAALVAILLLTSAAAAWMVAAVAMCVSAAIALRSHRRMRLRAVHRINLLQAQQAEVLGILQAMTTAVLTVEADGRVRSMNPAAAQLLDLSPLDDTPRTLEQLGVDQSLAEFVHGALEAGGRSAGERLIGAAPGQALSLRSEPMHDGSGALRGIVLVLDDVTRLRRLESMRSDFAANVSHELRTPITAIQGYAELLERSAQGECADHAAIIQRNTRRLSAIIEDLLSLSRLEDTDGTGHLVHEPVLVHEVLDAVARACSDEARDQQITLKVECHDHIECTGSAALLEQAVGNLVTNAIRYGPGGSTVEVKAHAGSDGLARLIVVDHGQGIAPEHHARLFERFYRVDRGRSRQVGGTGLGLAIVKHIALAHGGTVNLTATPEGGCTFTLMVPMADVS